MNFIQTVCKEATSRCGHIAVNYGPYLIVWGGYSSEKSFRYYLPGHELWVYSTENKLWYCMKTDTNVCPLEVSGATGCCNGDDLYVFGGHGSSGNSTELYRLDLTKYTWHLIETDLSPSPRDKAVSWFNDKKFYCFSGFGPPIHCYLADNGCYVEDTESTLSPRRGWNNQLVIYDTETGKWTNPCCKGDVPLPRAATAAAQLDSLVFIFGGRHKSSRLNDLHCLDLQNLKWTGELRTTGCLPCGRSWHTLTTLSDQRLFLYGGFDQNNVPLSDGWILDTITLTWCQLDYLPSDRSRLWHTANLSKEGEIIIFGGCCNNILDYSIENRITAEVATIQLQPYSLLRICLDEVYRRKSETSQHWEELPQSLCQWLQNKRKLEDMCTPYNHLDIDNDTNENEPGLACSIS